MAIRKSFETILDQEFRWPTKGDTPFVEADNPLENANNSDGFSRLVLMMEGYRKAAELMVQAADRDTVERSWLVYGPRHRADTTFDPYSLEELILQERAAGR